MTTPSLPNSLSVAIVDLRQPFGDGVVSVENIEPDPHLSQMSTQWTMIFQAHSGTPGEKSQAVSQLICRYSGAVHRYLLKALKDPDAAAELDQEFAVRFLRGDFRHCDPDRGRFRDYVKRRPKLDQRLLPAQTTNLSLDSNFEVPAAADRSPAQFEQQFLESWRKDLLDRAWNGLSELEKSSGQPYHTVLRSRVDHPDLPSAELAKQLSTVLGRPLTAGAVRQALQRSRRKYVDILLDEVVVSLDRPTQAELEEELSDLNLLDYCRPYLKRLR